jgi:ubiquitin C-terminal hydrolase
LTFSLEEVRNYKIQNLKNNFISMNQYMMNINLMLYNQNLSNFNLNIQNINSVDIYDCFEYNRKVEYLTGDNSIYCDRCMHKESTSYCEQLYALPKILIISLKREDEYESNIKLEFTEDLNLNQYVVNNSINNNYKLIGIISHLRENDSHRLFIACCKNPIDDMWYKYNDDMVTKIENLKNDIKDYIVPDVLFFQKQE